MGSKKRPSNSLAAQQSIRGLVIEASFEELSPDSREEVTDLVEAIDSGEKTIAQAVKGAGPAARRRLEALLAEYEITPDLLRRVRKAQLAKSLTDPETRAEALAAVRIAQQEESISTLDSADGGLSKEMRDAARAVLEARKQLTAQAKEEYENDDRTGTKSNDRGKRDDRDDETE